MICRFFFCCCFGICYARHFLEIVVFPSRVLVDVSAGPRGKSACAMAEGPIHKGPKLMYVLCTYNMANDQLVYVIAV